MKPRSAGALSGCFVWLIAFGLLSLGICPAMMFVAGIAPVTNSAQVEALVDPILCPPDSEATIRTYATTMQDDMGNEIPATGYEMHCIAPDGATVRSFEGSFGLALMAILGALGLLVAALCAFLLAAPVGALVARFLPKR
jgi:hypothetical protein